jgi:iron-sulfur cluster repair protein YtfE (RIC family)
VAETLETGLRHRLRRALRRIESQHVQMRALLNAVERAARTEEAALVLEPLAHLRDALAAHFELEDQVLFPALHGLSPGARVPLETLSDQHREFLSELDDMLASKRACDTPVVARLHASIGEHERREEQLLEELLGKEGLQEVR